MLHKAGRHMEDSMIAAYVGLLVGYLVMNNKVTPSPYINELTLTTSVL